MGSFVDDIEAFIAKAEKRAMAVFHGAAQDVAEQVIRPVNEGGHMRIDTGFLRGSFMGSLESMPSINPNARPPSDAAKNSFPSNADQINLVIAGAGWNDTIYMGFTASYARPREFKDGFVRLAAQNWDHIVYDNVLKAMKAYP
ncbi:MAG: hypothetical protein QM647_15100 [Asticcacaulis sp.]|uniref:hypothetical protein n=1 Tax=Asticcacaulis sp. TaxID=1872648 RepID=UPI0039E522D4